MFLRTPWLVPLLIGIIGIAVLVFLQPLTPRQVTIPAAKPAPAPLPGSNKKARGFLVIRGEFVIIGKSPDGDSVRFRPDSEALLTQLKNPSRIKVSKDGTVQLRFEGIDAPELHYGDLEQPLGAKSRDVLLATMGFTNISVQNRQVRASTPATIRGLIFSQAAEGNGRPISYVLVGTAANGFDSGSRVELSTLLLQKTLNAKMLENGMAYYTVYSSTSPEHRSFLRGLTLKARAAKLGVWAIDQTNNFRLKQQSDIGFQGQLILPKLFRRSSDYLSAVQAKKFTGSLPEWLRWTQTQQQSENDVVQVGQKKQRLADVLQVQGSRVQLGADMLDLVFLEK